MTQNTISNQITETDLNQQAIEEQQGRVVSLLNGKRKYKNEALVRLAQFDNEIGEALLSLCDDFPFSRNYGKNFPTNIEFDLCADEYIYRHIDYKNYFGIDSSKDKVALILSKSEYLFDIDMDSLLSKFDIEPDDVLDRNVKELDCITSNNEFYRKCLTDGINVSKSLIDSISGAGCKLTDDDYSTMEKALNCGGSPDKFLQNTLEDLLG